MKDRILKPETAVKDTAIEAGNASHSIALSQCIAIMHSLGGIRVWRQVIWNEEPGGNVEHVEEHGLTVEDVEHVVESDPEEGISRSSGWPCLFGYTPDGTYIIVVYELIDEDTIYPITAYEVSEP